MISIKPVLQWLPPVALGFACVSAAAQTPRLGVSMDETILELEEGFEFQVAGQHIDEPPYDVTVVVAGVDVTSVVTIAPTFEMEDDVDHDGVLEDYTGEFSV